MPQLQNSKERCYDCGDKAVHAHHVVPKSLGGTKTVNLCALCHGKVHNRKFIDSSSLVKKALAERRASGYWHGVPPYGYDLKDGKLVRNKEEFKVLKLILKLDSEGKSSGEISREFGRRKLAKRNGSIWDRSSVYHFVAKYRQRQREGLEPDK